MKDLLIYGGGGHCYALIELIRTCGLYNPVMIIDRKPPTSSVLGVPVQITFSDEKKVKAAVVAIGNNVIRKKIYDTLSGDLPSFVHPSAVIYPSAKLGTGIQILPQTVIDAAVTIGNFSIINNNATVSHNAKLGPFVHVAINAAISGGCEIGEGVLVGANSVILPNIKVGRWAIIGAGAVVTQDVPDGVTVVGNPAKILKSNNE